MERQNLLGERNTFIVLLVLYAVGTLGHSFSLTFPYMIILTPYTLVLAGLLVLISVFMESFELKLLLWCTGVFILTFVLEAIGVASGLIFGHYQYGNVLGFKIFDVPLVIGFNWMFVLLGAISFSQRLLGNTFKAALLASLISIIFDYLMEPVAISLGYWHWIGQLVPVQNYAAWGIFVFLASLSFFKLNLQKIHVALAEKYFFIQMIFFFLLNVILLWT